MVNGNALLYMNQRKSLPRASWTYLTVNCNNKMSVVAHHTKREFLERKNSGSFLCNNY